MSVYLFVRVGAAVCMFVYMMVVGLRACLSVCAGLCGCLLMRLCICWFVRVCVCLFICLFSSCVFDV